MAPPFWELWTNVKHTPLSLTWGYKGLSLLNKNAPKLYLGGLLLRGGRGRVRGRKGKGRKMRREGEWKGWRVPSNWGHWIRQWGRGREGGVQGGSLGRGLQSFLFSTLSTGSYWPLFSTMSALLSPDISENKIACSDSFITEYWPTNDETIEGWGVCRTPAVWSCTCWNVLLSPFHLVPYWPVTVTVMK